MRAQDLTPSTWYVDGSAYNNKRPLLLMSLERHTKSGTTLTCTPDAKPQRRGRPWSHGSDVGLVAIAFGDHRADDIAREHRVKRWAAEDGENATRPACMFAAEEFAAWLRETVSTGPVEWSKIKTASMEIGVNVTIIRPRDLAGPLVDTLRAEHAARQRAAAARDRERRRLEAQRDRFVETIARARSLGVAGKINTGQNVWGEDLTRVTMSVDDFAALLDLVESARAEQS